MEPEILSRSLRYSAIETNLNQFNPIYNFTLLLPKSVFILVFLRTYNSSEISSSQCCSYFLLLNTNYVSRAFKAFSFNFPRNMR